jgi:DNA adenine methylase
LLPAILQLVPPSFGTYFEPFVGGGAMLFELAPERAEVGDINARLATTYEAVRDTPGVVIDALGSFTNTPEFFYEQRKLLNAPSSPELTAARFIYLNKTCFNGLYRENSRGEFNVPYGNNRDAKFLDANNLMACSVALTDVVVHTGDFSWVPGRAQRGDLVYFDPPYVPLSATSSFTQYNASGFGLPDQVRLRDTALALKERGVHVILSNSSSPTVRELYDGFNIIEVNAKRAINSKADGRGPVKEVLIC